MDPQTPATQPSAPVPASLDEVGKKDGSNKILMITIGVLLFGFGLLGGYLIANQTKTQDLAPIPTIQPSSTPSPTPKPSPTPNPNNKIIKAGMDANLYSIEVPKTWTDSRENTQAGVIDRLTLSKNGYTLTIYQAAMGGGGCLYPGDAPSEMAQTFTNFAEIKNTTDTLRRSWNQTNAQTITYTVCKKATDGSYGTFSSFGVISAVSPNPADAKILAEIDAMLASLVKE